MDVRKAIENTGGILKGEFLVALKKDPNVASMYINLDPMFTFPALISQLGDELIKNWLPRIEVIAGPAVGGIPLVFAGANATHNTVRTVWADKQADSSFAFERMGFAKAVRGKRVLVVEDVTSTGSSTKAVCDLVREAGGELIGASVVWNRGNVTTSDINAPLLNCLVEESIETWAAEQHPHWGEWPLVTDVGHPDHFPDYPGPKIKLLS